MRKIIALILVASMMLTLVACSSAKTQESIPQTTQFTEEAMEMVTTEMTEAPTEPKPAPEHIVFEEPTVIDNEFFTITISEFFFDELDEGYKLKANFVNKSQEEAYQFYIDSASVNGIGVEANIWMTEHGGVEVPHDDRVDGEIRFDRVLNQVDIERYTDIELKFSVNGGVNNMEGPVGEASVHLYPYGENEATVFTREPRETDNVLVDNDSLTITVIGYNGEEKYYGNDGYYRNGYYDIYLYFDNKTNDELMISVEEEYVNDQELFPASVFLVNPGRCALGSIPIYSWELEDVGISKVAEVESIDLRLVAYLRNTYVGHLVDEMFTLIP